MANAPTMFDLSGKTAVITGSSKGIGRAIAEQMASAGANVVISSRKQDSCDAVADDINRNWAKGGKAIALACHIGERSQCDALIQKSIDAFGKIDILVCNAAVNPFMGRMNEISEEAFDKTMNANVKSNVWLCNAACADMAKRRDGVVVVIASTGGLYGSDKLGTYSMSKAADMQLVRNLTVEWGADNIRSNCIAPSLVKTDMAKALWTDPKRAEAVNATFPLQRMGEPNDIAGMAVMLASRSGAWISGQTLVIDGGKIAGGGRYA